MIDAASMQKSLGVTADGIIGANTLRALFSALGANPTRAGELGLAANVHFRTYGILDSDDRLAHFLAQVAHESGGFKYMEEIWGPTPAQKGYEGRKDLGNVVTGDGLLFKGRGPLQLTGRANYRDYGRFLGVDFMNHPEIVAFPSIGLWVACEFWKRNFLAPLADKNDIEGIAKRINGGLNGLDDRKAWLGRIRKVMG